MSQPNRDRRWCRANRTRGGADCLGPLSAGVPFGSVAGCDVVAAEDSPGGDGCEACRVAIGEPCDGARFSDSGQCPVGAVCGVASGGR
jgi:hypothetical protein